MQDLLMVGTSISQDKEQSLELAKAVFSDEKFDLLREQIKIPTSMNIDDFVIVDAYLFESKRKSKEDSYSVGKGIMLLDNSKQVLINALIMERSGKKTTRMSAIVAETLHNKCIVSTIGVEESGSVDIRKKELSESEKEELFSTYKEPVFPINDSYEVGILDSEINTQGFADGCLWGGYKWCGGNCANFEERGGDGTWLNDTDLCCKWHDYCYRDGYMSKKECDYTLCYCVKDHYNPAGILIKTAFGCLV